MLSLMSSAPKETDDCDLRKQGTLSRELPRSSNASIDEGINCANKHDISYFRPAAEAAMDDCRLQCKSGYANNELLAFLTAKSR